VGTRKQNGTMYPLEKNKGSEMLVYKRKNVGKQGIFQSFQKF